MNIHIAFGIISGFMYSLGIFEHIPHRQEGTVELSDCYVSVLAPSHGRLFPHNSERESLLARWVLPSNVTTEM